MVLPGDILKGFQQALGTLAKSAQYFLPPLTGIISGSLVYKWLSPTDKRIAGVAAVGTGLTVGYLTYKALSVIPTPSPPPPPQVVGNKVVVPYAWSTWKAEPIAAVDPACTRRRPYAVFKMDDLLTLACNTYPDVAEGVAKLREKGLKPKWWTLEQVVLEYHTEAWPLTPEGYAYTIAARVYGGSTVLGSSPETKVYHPSSGRITVTCSAEYSVPFNRQLKIECEVHKLTGDWVKLVIDEIKFHNINIVFG